MIPALNMLIELLSFVAVVAVTMLAVRQFEQSHRQRRRLGSFAQEAWGGRGAVVQETDEKNPFLRWIASSSSISDTKERGRLRRELSLAGFNHQAAPVWFVIIRFGLAIGLPLAFLLLQAALAHPASGMKLVLYAVALCGAGLFAPAFVVSRLAAERRAKLEFEFPDALDLMVVCVEAGLSLDATFVRIGKEVRESHPRISEEFTRVSEELRAGRSRADALRALAERTDVAGIKSFAALAIQTEALGTSIAVTLRTYSAEMRETRYLKAEEKAMRIPVLMTVPIVTCILPVIVSALLLPAIIDVVRHLIPALIGHGAPR